MKKRDWTQIGESVCRLQEGPNSMSDASAIPTTDATLTELVCALSLAAFDRPFEHHCRYNTRLRAVAGRYLLGSHDIEFSATHARLYGLEELTGTILHELCHYHLHLAGAGFRHRDRDFKVLLKQVGGSRYAKPVEPTARAAHRYIYQCTRCMQRYERRRKMDTKRYVCGRCRGSLCLAQGESTLPSHRMNESPVAP